LTNGMLIKPKWRALLIEAFVIYMKKCWWYYSWFQRFIVTRVWHQLMYECVLYILICH